MRLSTSLGAPALAVLTALAGCGAPPTEGMPRRITPEMLPHAPDSARPACAAELSRRFDQPLAGIFQTGTGPTAAGWWVDLRMAGRDGTWRCATDRAGKVVTVTPI